MSQPNFENTRDFTEEEWSELNLHVVPEIAVPSEPTPRWLQLARSAGRLAAKGFDGAVYGLGLVTADPDAWDRFAAH